MAWNFPIARRGWLAAMAARRNWLDRHRHPFNYWVHLVGIPLALAGLVGFAFVEWPWALGAVVAGYALQWAGHRVEGNDVGELIPIKRALGLPVVSVAPPRL